MQTIRPEALPKWFDDANARHRLAALTGLRKAAARCEGLVKIRTSQAKPFAVVDTGRLKSSWFHYETEEGAILANDTPYIGPMELGIRPGRVPLPDKGGGRVAPFPSLVRWAERKFGKQIKASSGLGFPGRTAADRKVFRQQAQGAAAFGIAAAVQRKLHYRGTPGRHMLTAPEFVAKMGRVTASEVGRELREVAHA